MFIEELSKEPWDLFVVIAYGKILPEKIISMPRFGTINVHYSLLPKFRGATPVEATLLAGETETGIAIQKMVFELDAGPIIREERYQIKETETAPEVKMNLSLLGAEILPGVIEQYVSGTLEPKEQVGEPTFCTKIKKEDGKINLEDDGVMNYRKFKAYYGSPGTFFFQKHQDRDIRVKITAAHIEGGVFVIDKVTPEGKKEMLYRDFLRGLR
jgi:methionyl-tRNA formyltransferase